MSALPQLVVTPAAERFMRRMVRFSGMPSAGFRLSVSAGGCSGLASQFSVEPAPQVDDAELSVNGLRLFLPAESRLLLDGVTIDFHDGMAATGLSFVDPRAGACGCSSSAPAAAPAQASVSVGAIRRMRAPTP
ncbi:MAG: iron-sulfur cluster assembly accessory protein [Rubrivivax sp.]